MLLPTPALACSELLHPLLPNCRRPRKLTGWELWLCGETTGPLFAQAADGPTDSSGSDVTVVKKAVPTASNVDVDVLVKAGYRVEQVEQDLVNKVGRWGDRSQQ